MWIRSALISSKSVINERSSRNIRVVPPSSTLCLVTSGQSCNVFTFRESSGLLSVNLGRALNHPVVWPGNLGFRPYHRSDPVLLAKHYRHFQDRARSHCPWKCLLGPECMPLVKQKHVFHSSELFHETDPFNIFGLAQGLKPSALAGYQSECPRQLWDYNKENQLLHYTVFHKHKRTEEILPPEWYLRTCVRSRERLENFSVEILLDVAYTIDM